jgi:hypothetical protein
MSQGSGKEGGKVWSLESLDAILLAFWTLLFVVAAIKLFLEELLSAYWIELAGQLVVVSFILLSVYRLGAAYSVNALVWYPGCYIIVLGYSVLKRGAPLRIDVLIEHASYATIAFLGVVAFLRVYRYYTRKKKSKKLQN